MQDARVLLLLLLVLPACGEDQSPTAPTPGGSHGPGFSLAAGHRLVNSLADPGDGLCDARQCTLREAINDAGSTEISFVAGLVGPITLARPSAGGGSLVIEKTLTITGPGAGIVIQRRSTDPDFRILRIGSGVNVALTNLTIRHGKTDGLGGGIVNYGTLTLTNSAVAGNSAASGGGISNRGGALELFHSTVAGNSTTAGAGGGIGTSLGTLILTNSVITGNSASFGGGGISDYRGTATLTNSRIVGNSAVGDGGGILTFLGALTLRKSTVARNTAADGGGIDNDTKPSIGSRSPEPPHAARPGAPRTLSGAESARWA